MKNLPKALNLLSLAAILLLSPKLVSACTCGEYFTPPCAAYWRADVVFIGTVSEITVVPTKPDEEMPKAAVQFQVEKSFRGVINKQATIEILTGSCDYGLKIGEKYLVYANRKGVDGNLELRPCTRTRPVADAVIDLTYINGLNQKGQQSISGTVSGLEQNELERSKVIIKGIRENSEYSTSGTGRYSISSIQPGDYRVQLILPFEVEVLSGPGVRVILQSSQTVLEYKTTLIENQCDYREIQLVKVGKSASATISGLVIDEKGMPISNTFIHLYSVKPEQVFSSIDYEAAKTDNTGRYIFNKVRAGQYLMGVNLSGLPDFNTPYPKTFFPGVITSNKAMVISVSQNQQLSLQPFALPPKLAEKIVTGKLIWADGTPAIELRPNLPPNERPVLYLIDPNNIRGGSLNSFRNDGTDTSRVDGRGGFSFVGYVGQTYVIHVHAFNTKNEPMHAKHIKVKITDHIKPLKLVLSLPGSGNTVEVINKEINEQP
jgi:hypothetical protein